MFDGTQLVEELYGHPIREQLLRRPDMIRQASGHRWGDGSAPVLVTVLASSCAVTRSGKTPRTTTGLSRSRRILLLRLTQHDVINQPRLADEHGQRKQHRAIVNLVELLKSLGVVHAHDRA